MKRIRRKALSILLIIAFILNFNTGTMAGSFYESDVQQQKLSQGLVGFEGEHALKGDGSEVRIIVELVHQPAEVERVLENYNDKNKISIFSKGKTPSFNAKDEAEQDREDFLRALDQLLGQPLNTLRSGSGIEHRVTATYTKAINGFALTVPDTLVPELAELDCVYAIYPDEKIKLDLGSEVNDYHIRKELYGGSSGEKSTNQIGMAESRKYYGIDQLIEEKITGNNVTVGVIDSGVDYNHPDFADAFSSCLPNKQSPEDWELLDGKFYGRNYVENGRGKNDPMDDQGHGTHVAGTIGGRGVNTPISALGMAPEVNLVAYKVIDSRDSVWAGTLISAMEDAVRDGCEIINMSLGWNYENGPIHITTTALNNLALAYPQVLFVVAAGNSGPSSFSLGSPSTSPLVMNVANARIPSMDKQFTVNVEDENIKNENVKINLIRSEFENSLTNNDGIYELRGSFLEPNEDGRYKMLLLPTIDAEELTEEVEEPAEEVEEPAEEVEEPAEEVEEPAEEVEEPAEEVEEPAEEVEEPAEEVEEPAEEVEEPAEEVEEPAEEVEEPAEEVEEKAWDKLATGTQEEFEAYKNNHPGKNDWGNTIVVLKRGEAFDDTVGRLRELGGGAIIVINTEDGDYSNISFYQSAYRDYLPVFTVSYEEGMRLIEGMKAGREYDITFTNVEGLGEEVINSTSSRGPVGSTYDVRPDITANGTNVLSTVPKFVAGVDSYDYSYMSMTGTSMATPHISGFAALIKQQHPDWSALQIKAHLANTSDPYILNESVYTQGTGMVQPRIALENKDFYVTAENLNAYYRDSDGNLKAESIEGTTLSFGGAEYGKSFTKDVPVTIYNGGENQADFEISVDMGINKDFKVNVDKQTITVPANSHLQFNVTATLSSEADEGSHEGYLVLTQQGVEDPITLRLPFAVYVYEKGTAYNEDLTFIQVPAISNGENRHITNVDKYNSSESFLQYQFIDHYDFFDCLIADSKGEIIGAVDGYEYYDTGVGGNWYYWGLVTGMYLPYVERNGEIILSDKFEYLPEGHYKFVLHPQRLNGDEEYFEMDFVVDNTLPEIRLNDSADGTWYYTEEDDYITLTGNIFDQWTKYMEEAGINSPINYRVFNKETSQKDNIVVVKVGDEYYRAKINPNGNFTVKIPASIEVDTATVYYGDHFLPVGQEWEWDESQAVESFSSEKLCYKMRAPYDGPNSIPWMYYYAYRAANMGEFQINLAKKSMIDIPEDLDTPDSPDTSNTPSTSDVHDVPDKDSTNYTHKPVEEKEDSIVKYSDNSKQVELSVDIKEGTNTASTTISKKQFDKIVDMLVDNKSDKLVIVPETSKDIDGVEVELPRDAQAKLAEVGADLIIKIEKVVVTIPNKILGAIDKGVLRIKISLKENDAVEISLKLDGVEVESLSDGLEIALSAVGAADSRYVMVLKQSDGKEKVLRKSVVLSDGTIYAKIKEQGVVGIECRGNFFADTESHWGRDAIAFVTSRELFVGKTQTSFGPNDPMNRGMLVTVLNRLEDEVKPEVKQVFEDVNEDAYYAEAVGWAAEKGIVSGIGDGKFAPDKFISREQLATMLYRYAMTYDYVLEKKGTLEYFVDGNNTSTWAKDAMSWCTGNGIINGNSNGMLKPKDIATRAEVATILQRFVEAIAK